MKAEAIIREYERQKTERHRIMVRCAMEMKASKGFLVGPPRLGYTVERTREGSYARLMPELAPFLRRAFDMVLEDCPMWEIIDWLKEQGITGQRGNPIRFTTTQRMLTDPYYAGLTKNTSGLLIPGSHERIVDPATFFHVQQKLQLQLPKEALPPDVSG